nr:hypothetical protein [Tanacetum cinerariifolium]
MSILSSYRLLPMIYQSVSRIEKPLNKLTRRNVRFEWREKKEDAFQQLKKKLCSAVILESTIGSENFVVYCDILHKGLGTVLMQREKAIAYASHQLKVHEKDYTTHDLEIRSCSVRLKDMETLLVRPRVANILTDVLSRKERIKLLRVRALDITIDLKPPSQISNAQAQTMKGENAKEENHNRIDKNFETRADGMHCIEKQSWIPDLED